MSMYGRGVPMSLQTAELKAQCNYSTQSYVLHRHGPAVYGKDLVLEPLLLLLCALCPPQRVVELPPEVFGRPRRADRRASSALRPLPLLFGHPPVVLRAIPRSFLLPSLVFSSRQARLHPLPLFLDSPSLLLYQERLCGRPPPLILGFDPSLFRPPRPPLLGLHHHKGVGELSLQRTCPLESFAQLALGRIVQRFQLAVHCF
mmetsp:Transcript_42831/g.115190  ORF Transcript_42831/g.115190 Transcript_42831/m.115190 type:complete len:202 (+) Transcript_42831:177-782(+)